MKIVFGYMAAVGLALAGTMALQAQDTRESAVSGMRKVDPKEMDASYTTAAPYAQKLLDEQLAKHPEIILMAIHAGKPKYWIVASNFGRIGKLGDEDDLRVIHTGKKNFELNEKGNHLEDELQMKDTSGRVVGALAVVYNYKPGDDKAAKDRLAEQILKEVDSKIKSEKQLLGPA